MCTIYVWLRIARFLWSSKVFLISFTTTNDCGPCATCAHWFLSAQRSQYSYMAGKLKILEMQVNYPSWWLVGLSNGSLFKVPNLTIKPKYSGLSWIINFPNLPPPGGRAGHASALGGSGGRQPTPWIHFSSQDHWIFWFACWLHHWCRKKDADRKERGKDRKYD